MIPIFHQALHILALSPRVIAEETGDTPDFDTALAAQDDTSTALTTTISAEVWLAAGMAVASQPILAATSIDVSPPVIATGPMVPLAAPAPNVFPAADQPLPATLDQAAVLVPPDPNSERGSTAAETPSLITTPEMPASIPQQGAPPINKPATAPPEHPDILPARPLVPPQGTTTAAPALQTMAASDPSGNHPKGLSATIPTSDQLLPPDQLQAEPAPQTDAAETLTPPVAQSPSISMAESAWQTRLQITSPGAAQPKPAGASTRTPTAIAHAIAPDSPIAIPEQQLPQRIAAKAAAQPSLTAALILSAPREDRQQPILTTPEIVRPQHVITAAQTRPSSGLLPNPTATTVADDIAALPDQTTVSPASDLSPHLSGAATSPAMTLQQPAPAQAVPMSLPNTVPAQLIHHAGAAQTSAVDVLLKPEELGHVKFQIHQQGDSVRITLSAERPETLDLLRRHSDQLLQEFRQSGFSQASLSFGQWGQQQRSAPPPAEFTAARDADTEKPTIVAPNAAAAAPYGGGLNLRL